MPGAEAESTEVTKSVEEQIKETQLIENSESAYDINSSLCVIQSGNSSDEEDDKEDFVVVYVD